MATQTLIDKPLTDADFQDSSAVEKPLTDADFSPEKESKLDRLMEVIKKFSKPQNVPPIVQKTAEEINVPERVGRAAAVGIGGVGEATGIDPATAMGLGTPTHEQILQIIHAAKNPKETLKNVAQAAARGMEAFQPGFKPSPKEATLAKVGEVAGNLAPIVATAGAGGVLPAAGEVLADTALAGGMTALNQVEGGKVKVLPSPSEELNALNEFSSKPGVKKALNVLKGMAPESIVGNAMIPASLKTLPMVIPKNLSDSAQKYGAKALGMTKRFLNTPYKIKQAKETAQILLDKGVITPLANAEEIASKADFLAQESGKNIGDYLKSVGVRGKFFDTDEAISDLEKLKPRTEAGELLKKGHNADINETIDKSIETIKEYGKKISFEEANKIKSQLQSVANYLSNKDATLLDKMIAGTFRKSIDNALDQVSNLPTNVSSYQNFLENKKVYGAAQHAVDPIFNRISTELGNKGISLTDWILAAPELAMGDPIKALGLLGGKRALQKYGASTATYYLNKIANPLKSLRQGIQSQPNILASIAASNVIQNLNIPEEGHQYLKSNFPTLYQEIINSSSQFTPDELRKTIVDSASIAEEAKLKGMNQEQAENFALRRFLSRKPKAVMR